MIDYTKIQKHDYKNLTLLEEIDLFNKEIDAKTKMYQKKYGFSISTTPGHETWNNEADAFKHAFMQAISCIRNSSLKTLLGGYFHEFETYTPLTQNETKMDIWNNTEGRKVVNEFFDYLKESKIDINSLSETQVEDILAQRINQKIRNRELITNPLDPRNNLEFRVFDNIYKYWGKEIKEIIKFIKNPKSTNKRIYTIDELKKMSGKEMENDFKEIWSQYKSGMPTNAQADEQVALGNYEYVHPVDPKTETRNVSSAGKIWVEPYKRDDGTPVSGYYRSRPQYS